MSKLDKIIYVSDKIANDRKGSKARIFRKRAYEDLNSTFAQALFYSSEKVVEKGGYVHFKTKQALKKY
ncbi:MAG: hypothetical protein DRP42_02360 [Tenericutes bacterium]|nr:MAG: hypothetical protein DRP42_02360 [Mycoplasmatota bacterium]